jgi:hypothetical protein
VTNLEVYVGPPVEPTDEVRRRGRGGALAVAALAVVLGAMVGTGWLAPGLLGTWTIWDGGGVPASITTPWSWQASVQDSPPGPSSLIFTGDRGDLLAEDGPGRIAVIGRDGTYRTIYPDHGRWTAGGNAHLSPDGRYLASSRLLGSGAEVSITDLITGEIRYLPAGMGSKVVGVYGWRSDGGAVAIGFRAGGPQGVLSLGVLDLHTGQTVPISAEATVPELAGDVTATFSADGRRLAVVIGSRIGLYETAPATPAGFADVDPLWTTVLDTGQTFSGVFSRDGRRIVLFDAPDCALLNCPAALTWNVAYLDAATGEVTDGPALPPFEAAAVRAVGWNEATGGLVVVRLTPHQAFGPTDRDARQIVQPGPADLYELRLGAEPRLLLDAPDEVTGLDVAADLVRAGRFGDRPSVPSVWPFERAPVDPIQAAVVAAALTAAGAVVAVRRWQGRRPRGRHAAGLLRPRPRSARSSGGAGTGR